MNWFNLFCVYIVHFNFLMQIYEMFNQINAKVLDLNGQNIKEMQKEKVSEILILLQLNI